ncbi:hypothetical protein EOS_35790 [Caballeronia mineralivorans PML1(12)]|uniref:Uncharacterized protein n=1 Tax=Caballeronia mineralivorans PML1(12) TaxID=908627 RepID=A0A0J1CLC4_9BURK|nr:hypothetical protein [Caballeronia mineralivorans]KLU21527.1 hypothetical protein EOS_35790 [Caballeronia mineralivorans PML1(12)]
MSVTELSASNAGVSLTATVTGASRLSADSFEDRNFLSNADAAMQDFIAAVTDRGMEIFKAMQARTELARVAQDMANRVDRQISSFSANGWEIAWTSTPVLGFVIDNFIDVDGKAASSYFKSRYRPDGGADGNGGYALNLADLRALKAAIDNFAARQTDVAQQGNLEIQKITTTYNYLITGCNSLTSLTGDLNKAIFSQLGRG